MRWAEFKRWLQGSMGLDAATVGPAMIERAVKSRMAACASPDLAGYWNFVRNAPTEKQELIEALIVPETWFFRDADAFAALAQVYDAEWAATHPEVPLRLLSLPCSSGEEPYSMAMALLDAGFPIERLDIEAIDISEQALARARRGRYGSNSFRGRDLAFRERHFEPVADGWQLSEAVREQVRFRWGNVLDIACLPGEAIHDVIFCRNLLIYFDQDTQVNAVGVLARLLRPEGLIFVGPAETGLMLNLGFVSAQMPMAFAFRKPESGVAIAAVPAAPRAAKPTRAFAKPAVSAVTRQSAAPIAPPDAAPALDPAPLEAAQALADAGRFAEAAVACEALLKAHGPSANVLCLLGLVHGAGGQRARAEVCFRKALYLEPHHEEALMHLALLLETKGDMAGGRVLRLRAKRHRETAD